MEKENQRNIQGLTEAYVGLSSHVEKQSHKIDKIYEAVSGNSKLGHKGLVDQINEIKDAHLEIEKNHLSFKEEIRKHQAKNGKIIGIGIGLGVVFFKVFGVAISKIASLL